jgi:hypothetical protein
LATSLTRTHARTHQFLGSPWQLIQNHSGRRRIRRYRFPRGRPSNQSHLVTEAPGSAALIGTHSVYIQTTYLSIGPSYSTILRSLRSRPLAAMRGTIPTGAPKQTYPESRVLLIITGGTICMQPSAGGLVPVDGFLQNAMAPRPSFNDLSESGMWKNILHPTSFHSGNSGNSGNSSYEWLVFLVQPRKQSIFAR